METKKNLNPFKNRALEIYQDFRSVHLFPGFTSGLVVGLVEVITAISFAALIYGGELSSFVGFGIGFAQVSVQRTVEWF